MKTSASREPSSRSATFGTRPVTMSSTAAPSQGMRTVWELARLAFTSTQTLHSSLRRQKPKTSSLTANGSKSPSTKTGSDLRTAMALR